MELKALREILQVEYGLRVSEISPIERGYTNQSFLVCAGGETFVLRCSWHGKSLQQADREERGLARLARHSMDFGVPVVVPRASGELHLRVDGHTLHLFTHVRGEVLYSWKERCSEAHLVALMRTLQQLHVALSPLELGSALGPLAYYEQQLTELEALEFTDTISATASIRTMLERELSEFLLRSREVIARAKKCGHFSESLQWCHGDFQLENILFLSEQVVGIVDFDTIRALPLSMDTAFSLFNLTRDGQWDEGFRWDRERWRRGAALYAGQRKNALVDLEWNELFCLNQALLHLGAGQRSIWRLDHGIGFVGAFRGVLAS